MTPRDLELFRSSATHEMVVGFVFWLLGYRLWRHSVMYRRATLLAAAALVCFTFPFWARRGTAKWRLKGSVLMQSMTVVYSGL